MGGHMGSKHDKDTRSREQVDVLLDQLPDFEEGATEPEPEPTPEPEPVVEPEPEVAKAAAAEVGEEAGHRTLELAEDPIEPEEESASSQELLDRIDVMEQRLAAQGEDLKKFLATAVVTVLSLPPEQTQQLYKELDKAQIQELIKILKGNE
jgi:hypothetical protein